MLATHPFISAYLESDLFGKIIILSLIGLSCLTWIVIVNKALILRKITTEAESFQNSFRDFRNQPLGLPHMHKESSPFYEMYTAFRSGACDILHKNKAAAPVQGEAVYLSAADMGLLDVHVQASISKELQKLEDRLFILSTVYGLGPFLGLLGTVWGIFVSLGDMASHGGSSSQVVVGGLAMALATTVLGLLTAIPALIAYNYFHSRIAKLEGQMQDSSQQLMMALEMQYRQVDAY